MHARNTLRNAIISKLKSANISGVGNNVFGSRSRKLWTGDLPAILVYTRTEDSKAPQLSSPLLQRTLKIGIEARATAGDDLEDVLDSLAEGIESAVAADETFGLEFVSSASLVETGVDLNEETQRPIGGIRLTYEVRYLTE